MPCTPADDIAADAALDAAASGPKRVATDGMEVEQHGLKDLIAADQYRRAKCAVRKPFLGLEGRRLIPPSAT